jgi:hypothetical protein
MFPDRVGRVVLDGVLDPDDYISGKHLSEVTHADEAFSTFFLYCNALGPDKCPLYVGTTPLDIYSRWEALIKRLTPTDATKQDLDNATSMEATLIGVKALSGSIGYSMTELPTLSTFLVIYDDLPVLDQNFTEFASIVDTTMIAISCADSGPSTYNRTRSEYSQNLQVMRNQSFVSDSPQLSYACAGWDIVNEDRFAGMLSANV